jgi:site-specific DNA-methyltransferase (adenine-specific)
MILCDLPYGTTACKWDAVIPFAPLWELYRRVCKKNAAIVLTASQPFTSALVMSNVESFRHEWVWVKNTSSGMMLAGKSPMKRHESVLVFSEAKPTFNPQKVLGSETSQNHAKKGYGYKNKASKLYNVDGGVPFVWSEYVNPHSVLPCDSVGNRDKGKVHPTQKPVALMEYLIRTYTNEGQTVLDNTMGSGTTGVACANTGRNFIGIERDETYFNIAKDRIQAAMAARPQRAEHQPS